MIASCSRKGGLRLATLPADAPLHRATASASGFQHAQIEQRLARGKVAFFIPTELIAELLVADRGAIGGNVIE